MRRLIKLLGVLFLIILVSACTSDNSSDDTNPNEQLMVEAYVYANEPVNHVKVARIHDDGEADLIPVNDANIKISQGNLSATLSLKSGAEGIYEISDPSFVFSGPENLLLEVIHDGKTYTATSKFPALIENLDITNNYVNITETTNDELPLTTLSWSAAEGGHTYCIFARGVDSDTSMTIYPIQPSSDSPLFALHDGGSIDLYRDHFTYIGSYQLYVSAVNEEYIQMYTENSAPDLRGAPSNIQGAWGVFTAFNGLSVDITVE
ncbi:MAG TPA: hypothetical protein VJ949_04765 [Cryomorphaceae bacterium]|nr:hypothetical protein [Cryomorphaceae bacterium]